MDFLFENDLQELEKLLKIHDWYFSMEDDHRYYKKGKEESEEIDKLVKLLSKSGKRDEAEKLWNKYAWTMPNSNVKYPFPILEKATSIAQQRLMGMAWAVRQGDLERGKVSDEVLAIADGDMTDKELEKFAKTKHEGLPKHVKENNTYNMKRRIPSLDEYENKNINESIEWWEITKGILAYDAIVLAIGVSGTILFTGGVLASMLVNKAKDWIKQRKDDKDNAKLQIKIKDIADKLEGDPEIKRIAQELTKVPFKNYPTTQAGKDKQKTRKKLLSDMAALVKSKLSDEETVFLKDINKFIRDSAAEEVTGVTESERLNFKEQINENNTYNMNNDMKKRVPSFDDFVSEGLVSIGSREKTDADKFGTQHKDAIPKSVPEIIAALQPDTYFEDKKGTIYKVVSNGNGKIKFMYLLHDGSDSNEVKMLPDTLFAKMFINREYFFTSKKKYSSFK